MFNMFLRDDRLQPIMPLAKAEKPPKAKMGMPHTWFHAMKMKTQKEMPHLKETEAIDHVRNQWHGLDEKTQQGIKNTHKSDDVKKTTHEELKDLHGTARNKERGKKISNNTYAVRGHEEGDYAVKLHQTHVVTAHPNGDYTLHSGGWKTPTTKDRMNSHLPDGTGVYSHKGEWHVHDAHGEKHPFKDGMRVNEHGTPVERRGKVEGHEGLRGIFPAHKSEALESLQKMKKSMGDAAMEKESKDSKRYGAEVAGTPYSPGWTPGGPDKKPIGGRDPKQVKGQKKLNPAAYPDKAPKATQPSMTAQQAAQRVVSRDAGQAKKSCPLERLTEIRKSVAPTALEQLQELKNEIAKKTE
jgi:hypothetical protein